MPDSAEKKPTQNLDPAHFCDICYRVSASDQMSYLWPFPLISCDHNSKIELRPAGEMGLGVFAKQDIEEEEYLCCYFGKLTHIAEEYNGRIPLL